MRSLPHIDRLLLTGAIALGIVAWVATLYLIDHALTVEIRKALVMLMPRRFGMSHPAVEERPADSA